MRTRLSKITHLMFVDTSDYVISISHNNSMHWEIQMMLNVGHQFIIGSCVAASRMFTHTNAGEITITEAQTTRIMDAEAVLIGDSTTKYVDRDRFMGRHRSYLQRASTSTTSKKLTSEWPIVENAKYAVLHVGVNDVRDGVANEIIENNIRHSLSNMHLKFPNAHIVFTEIVYVGEECSRPDINGKIKSINETMANFCEQQNFTFVKHTSLQSPECDLYDDDVHINRSGGTATLVSDIHRAVGLHQRSCPNTDQRMYGRRSGQHARGRYDDRVSSSGGPVTGDRGARPSWRQQRNDHANLDHMLQLLAADSSTWCVTSLNCVILA